MNSLPPGQTQIVVRMPEALYAAAKERAATDERSLAQLIRYACRLYVAGRFDRQEDGT